MPLFNNRYQTESNRLKNWDYSSEAIYFITLVTKNREGIFGVIEDNKMILNDNGKIVETELLKSITIRERWFFHNWVIMPNHIHLLVEIVSVPVTETINDEMQNVETHNAGSLNVETHNVETHNADTHNADTHNAETHNAETHNAETHCSASLQLESKPQNLSRKPNSISSFVAIFKSVTTKQINTAINNNNNNVFQRREAPQCISNKETEQPIIKTIWQSNYHDHIVRNYNSFDKIYHYIKNNPKNWNADSTNSNLE